MNETSDTTLNNEFRNSSSLINVILLAVTMFSLSFITILGNTIVIYALRTNRHLRTVIFSSELLFLLILFNKKIEKYRSRNHTLFNFL